MFLLIVLAVTILIVIGGLILVLVFRSPRGWAEGTKGGLLGEIYIDSHETARSFADKALEEALSIWSEPSSNWEKVSEEQQDGTTNNKNNNSSLEAEARRITSGPNADSGILLTRSEGVVRGAARDVFKMLTSAEGFQMIDPISDPAEMNLYIEKVENWRKDKRSKLLIAESYIRTLPSPFVERHHVVLNAHDEENLLFCCKSIVHDSRPGASKYFEGIASSVGEDRDDRIRALTSFAIQVIPASDVDPTEVSEDEDKKGERSIVKIINYTDLMIGSDMMNWAVCKGFFPGLYTRLDQYDYSKRK